MSSSLGWDGLSTASIMKPVLHNEKNFTTLGSGFLHSFSRSRLRSEPRPLGSVLPSMDTNLPVKVLVRPSAAKPLWTDSRLDFVYSECTSRKGNHPCAFCSDSSLWHPLVRPRTGRCCSKS